MTRFAIETHGPVAVVSLEEGENKLGSASLGRWNATLDTVEANPSSSSLVVVGRDKHWSTGLDLDEVTALNSKERSQFFSDVDVLLKRLLTFPMVTVAALNGHTYAAGALLALAFDYRIMREDRGYFCLPSVDVGIPFSEGMSALIAAKIPQPAANDLVVSCRRMGGAEAAAAGVVHRAASEEAVLPVSIEYGHAYAGKDRTTLATAKERLYLNAVALLSSG